MQAALGALRYLAPEKHRAEGRTFGTQSRWGTRREGEAEADRPHGEHRCCEPPPDHSNHSAFLEDARVAVATINTWAASQRVNGGGPSSFVVSDRSATARILAKSGGRAASA